MKKTLTTLGVILIIAGIAIIAIRQFTYTEEEKVLDVGPVQATVKKERRVEVPTIIGILVGATGIVLLATQLRKKR